MIDFTGIQCVNCREFESKIWIDKGVGQRMKNDFVVAFFIYRLQYGTTG
jgi:thiol:disulfide interchange protein DsbD